MPFSFSRAIVRLPAASYHLGLTTADPGQGDLERFKRQHRAYVDALIGAGLEVTVLEPLEAFPDAQFVEDVAVIVPEAIIVTRPGAPSRRQETGPIEAELGRYGELLHIDAPGTLDGGDVLVIGRDCFIGRSARTNADGARQLTRMLQAHGYSCRTVPVTAGLHLKSSVTAIADDTVVATAAFAEHAAFAGYRRILVDADEDYAANLLRIRDCLLVPAGFPKTIERVAACGLGLDIVPLDMGEARRMDGALTCLSLRF